VRRDAIGNVWKIEDVQEGRPSGASAAPGREEVAMYPERGAHRSGGSGSTVTVFSEVPFPVWSLPQRAET